VAGAGNGITVASNWGTQAETPDTDKERPSDYRASTRPYQELRSSSMAIERRTEALKAVAGISRYPLAESCFSAPHLAMTRPMDGIQSSAAFARYFAGGSDAT
jgi:hypothetical protein